MLQALSKEVGFIPLTDEEAMATKTKWEQFLASVHPAQ
jgi:hypothetical protein